MRGSSFEYKEILPSIGALLAFSGFCMAGYELYFYFKNGEWLNFSLLDTIEFISNENSFSNWLRSPQDWIGLSDLLFNILNFTPLSAALALLGILIIWFYALAQKNKQ